MVFPSSSNDWRHQISYFQRQGYGIIAPDMLGYGQSSKPLETKLYNGKGISTDIHDILVHERIENVIGIGHDWGSFVLSRLANYYPSLLSRLVFLDVGYTAPNHGLTREVVKSVNSVAKEKLGYSVFGYFLFFSDDDAAHLLDIHSDSALSLFHTRDEELGKKYMGAEGGIREWLEQGKMAEPASYLTSEDHEYNRKLFSHENGGYGPGTCWYKAQLEGINQEDEKDIPEENHIIKHPTLLLAAANFITAAANFPDQMKAFVPNLEVKHVNTGHWIQLEKADEVNEIIDNFLNG